ncbi:MAG: TonB-dependent receptor [Bacteroidales bacterium]
MKRFGTHFLLFAILAGPLSAFGQASTGTIRGTILNGTDQAPFEQVNVAAYLLPDSTLTGGVATDANGSFSITGLPVGRYLLVARYVGFVPYQTTIDLTDQQPVHDLGTIRLQESAQALQGVEVVAAKPEIIYQADKKVLNVAQIKQTGATTLVQVLENAPGITVDAQGNVLLRGSSNYKLLIDGKPSPVAGTSLLQQLPVDMVENIEIMTNPSAKYEAEGNAGIINLVLKKQKAAGFNGQATLTAGWNNKYIGDLQAGYRKQKVNIFAGLSGNYIETSASGIINRIVYDSLNSFDRNSYLDQAVAVKSLNFNAGLDYDINSRNSIGVSSRLGKMYNNVDIVNQTTTGITDGPPSGWILFNNALNLDAFFYNPQVNYRHKFNDQGHQLDIDVFAGGISGTLAQLSHEYASDADWTPGTDYLQKNQTSTLLDIRDIRFKSDYVRPFESGNKLETGAQLTLYHDQSDFSYFDFDRTASDWVLNNNYSNDFLLLRDIYAAYGMWSGSIKKMNYTLGLRGEFTDQTLKQKTMEDEYHSSAFNLFPSGSASWELPKSQSVQFSFSRRIVRPSGLDLNPFPQFVDNATIRVGNPDLMPQLTQSFELSWQKQVKIGSLSAQGYYRRDRNVNSFGVVLDELNRTVLKPVNANLAHSSGVELNGNLQATKWLRLIANTNVYHYLLQDPTMADSIANQNITWSARLNSIFLLGKNTRFVVTGNYTGPTLMLQGRSEATFMVNLGLTQTMMNRQASLTLGVRDLFRTARSRFTTYSNGLTVYTNMRGESPMVTLTFTYNLNNYQQRVEEEQLNMNFIR